VTKFVLGKDITSWGRISRSPQRVAAPRFRPELRSLLIENPSETVLAVGLRRSYGDSVLNSHGNLIAMEGLDRFIVVDLENGILRAEAGVTLSDIIKRVVPHGWFLPVTPGTRYVTLGGAIANDVHGKNHHVAGTFGRHVTCLSLLRRDGSETVIGPSNQADLFAATIGGLGLTGIIQWAEIRLQRIASSQLDVESVPFTRLSEFWDLSRNSIASHEHTVAWIDCTAGGSRACRGIFSRANWSRSGALTTHGDTQRLKVPFAAPNFVLNNATVALFNQLYYRAGRLRAGVSKQHYSTFFYPLDGIADWNRLYGTRGFWQYQCALPPASMEAATAALLDEITKSRQGSFLAVLKTLGSLESPGMLSFPCAGSTLALDFPNQGSETLELLARLDAVVAEAGGRLYPAKDGRMPKSLWLSGYPAAGRFAEFVDPGFSSDFWRRVGG
jgi:FAD/FMN-containing dehydrogenase